MDGSTRSDRLVRRRLSMLEKNMPGAVGGDAAALHQARVASRRIREALALVTRPSRKLMRQVRTVTRALGPVRELDVALILLDELDHSGGVPRQALTRLRQAVRSERERMFEDMRRRLRGSSDLAKLRKRALATTGRSGRTGGRVSDPQRLERAQQRAGRRAGRLRAAMENAAGMYLPDRLHEVRIAVKKLRYALELVRELSGSRAMARVRTLKRAQDLLGRMHDLEVLIARTRGLQGGAGAPNLKLSGELDRIVRRLETECRQLHGQYMGARQSLVAVCEYAIAAATGSSQAA
jgi:CHAD domain-containing protein